MSNKTTPMMEQWFFCKKKAKDALLFFRLGDFYEAFYEDAKTISKEINLTLTKRQNIPMCGVPYLSCEQYIDKLIKKGYKIAIAEQIEKKDQNKGLVKRDIVRIITPATLINSSLLKDKSNNFFLSLDKIGSLYGMAIIDMATSEFKVFEFESKKKLKDEIYKIKPKEFLLSDKLKNEMETFFEEISYSYKFILNTKEKWNFDYKFCYESLISHFKVHSLDGFGLQGISPAINASGALLNYLKDDLCLPLDHLQNIKKENTSSFMEIDHICFKNLEITESKNKGNTLLDVIDFTKTPMGGRLLKQWIKHPLTDEVKIKKRQDAISEFFIKNKDLSIMENIRDLERLMMKIKSGFSSPKDLIALNLSLENSLKIKNILFYFKSEIIQKNIDSLLDLKELTNFIKRSISDNPPMRISDGNIIKEGFSKEIDELRKISKNSKEWIANYQKKIKEETKIKTLKVGYNKIFGYYIEVSKGQISKVPKNFQRKQTLVNAERFISEELKIFEHKILTAEEKIKALESALYRDIIKHVSNYLKEVFQIAKSIAVIDALYSLFQAAKKNKYIKPKIHTGYSIDIKKSRHPIIEKQSFFGNFIPNDILIDKENSLSLITGPNMAGKSTYIRQIALIIILAQMGSFIPAKEASIAIVDKIFARIGANDNITQGQSTFMVEMSEAANILNNATSKSLIILDEIGRGTSTYDGISLAWSIAEYLIEKKAKTLFATHYFELTKLEKFIGVKNYNVSIKETQNDIIFLRKIKKGFTDKSFGIHVAKLAGLPKSVIEKAKKILPSLEKRNIKQKAEPLFSYIQSAPIVEEIKNIKPENLTPMQALEKIFELHKKAKK